MMLLYFTVTVGDLLCLPVQTIFNPRYLNWTCKVSQMQPLPSSSETIKAAFRRVKSFCSPSWDRLKRRRQQTCELPAFPRLSSLPFEIQTCAPPYLPPADCTTWEAKVELILSALSAKAVAHCLRSAEMCAACIFSFCLFAFMSQVHYFVIVMTRKAPVSLPPPTTTTPTTTTQQPSESVKIEYCI